MNLKEVLGKNIKRYRKIKGLSQEQLSEFLNISQQTLSKIESGKNFLTSETLEKIPHILGVNAYELFMDGGEYTSDNVLEDINRYLSLLKTNPQKLECVHRIIKDIAFL